MLSKYELEEARCWLVRQGYEPWVLPDEAALTLIQNYYPGALDGFRADLLAGAKS